MKSKLTLLTLTAGMIAAGMSVSGTAQANAYATATNNLENGFIFIGQDTNLDGIPDTLNSAIVAASPISTSSTGASLTSTVGSSATGESASLTGSAPDAPVSNGDGSAPVRTNENVNGSGYYNLFGELGSNYSWGDANVVQEQSLSPIQGSIARNAAEINIAGTGSGAADGTNVSSTVITAAINIGTDCDTITCALSFSFDADPYIKTVLDLDAGTGSVATGDLNFTFTLTKLGSTIPTFMWSPDGDCVGGIGTCGGVLGGTELRDDESLNLTRESLIAGQTEVHSGPYAAGTYGSYFAYTNALESGEYTLSISMVEKVSATRIPEPGTLALFGLALTGFALRRRCTTKKS